MTDFADRQREKSARHSRKSFAESAEIGPLPEVQNPERKAECRTDLLQFLTSYFPQSTGLYPFSEDHKRMIARLQRCILFGGLMAHAVYRGFAKTTIGERACLWAALYGHREFIILIGADKDATKANMESVKGELEGNDLLFDDFPEVCYPIRALDKKAARAPSQKLDGQHTNIGWTAEAIVFPEVEGSDSSGVCLRPQSLMAYSRGIKHSMPDGRQVRPQFVFGDDLQTDESALSPSQVQKRGNKLNRDVLMSAGHEASLAAYIAGTIIEKDDLVDQLLDPEKSPDWHGERVPMVKSWSKVHEEFWLGEYADTRRNWDRDKPEDKERARRDAMLLYERRRDEADAGCEVSWEHCYKKKESDYEITAVQHAYNLLIDRGPVVFEAECQNNPPDRMATDLDVVEPDDVIAKAVGPDRGVVPSWGNRLTAFIDVQNNMLWYVVAAWADNFTGCIVDYGAFPEQARSYFTKADAKKTIAKLRPRAGLEGQLWGALETLTARLLDSPWMCEDGTERSIDLCLIDEGYQTDTVYEFCKRSDHASRVMPAKGVAIKASNKPFEEYEKRPGQTLGQHWRRVKVGGKPVRHIVHDPNFWKTFVWNRIKVATGDSGDLQIYKASRTQHQMLADHVAASEYPVRVEGQGRTVEEWQARPNRDNDLLDCVVGASVAASVLGCSIEGQAPPTRTRKRMSLSDYYGKAS